MQEGEPWHTVKERRDSRTRIKALLVRAPRLQRGTRHLKHRGRLTLGDPLGFEIAIPRKQVSAFDAIPALMAILVASLRRLDYCAHSDLLCPPCAFVYVMAKDGGVAFWFQPFVVSSCGLSRAVRESKWPTR